MNNNDLRAVHGIEFDGIAPNHYLALFRKTVGTSTPSLALVKANALKLALIPVGYADGFLRALGNRGAAIFLPRLSPAIPRAVV
jgi:hypothetical protein